MSKSKYNLKEAFDDLNNVLSTKSVGSEKKKRGRPSKKGSSIASKEPNLFYDTNTATYQQAIDGLGYLLHEYKDNKDVAKKSRDILCHIALIVINSGLLENGQEDDWAKIVLETLSLIEVLSRMKYNQCELYSPEGQRYFFVDFNKWTISVTISTTASAEANRKIFQEDESADVDIDGQNLSVNEHVLTMTFDPVEGRIKDSIEKIFTNQKIKPRTQQPKVSVSIGILQPHSSSFNTTTALDTLSKSLEASKTPTSDRIDRHINILKDTDFDEVTLVNVDESQNNTSTFNNILAKSRSQLPKNVTPPPLPISSSSNENSPCNNINSMDRKSLTQILENNYNVNHRYAFPPPKQRTKPLNLSASKQKSKISNNADLVEKDNEIVVNKTILNNECSSSSAIRSNENVSTTVNVNSVQKRTDQSKYDKDNPKDIVRRQAETRNDTKVSNGTDLENARYQSNVAKNNNGSSVKNDKLFGLPRANENLNSLAKANATRKNLFNNVACKNKNDTGENREVSHGGSKRKALDLNDDGPEYPEQYRSDDQLKSNSNYRVITKKGGKKLVVVDDDESQIMSEEEFWNPKQNNYDSSSDIESFTNYLGEDEDKDDEEISMQDDSSPTINDNDEAIQEHDNGQQTFADEQLDEEIRSLLQLVGEAIFKQFQKQDSTLFQASENAIIQSETNLSQSLEKQFERKNNYTLIASESQQMMNKLKEGRNDLETMERTLIDMETMDLDFGINIE
ncbi:4814_t:CDS:10, partial [Racocetra fulgida]